MRVGCVVPQFHSQGFAGQGDHVCTSKLTGLRAAVQPDGTTQAYKPNPLLLSKP